MTRWGPLDKLDVSVKLSAISAQLEGRYALILNDFTSVIGGIGPYYGWLSGAERADEETESRMSRLGVQLPFVIALSVEDIYQLWAGGRFGVERATGHIEEQAHERSLSATVIRPGALFGFSVGFRRMWALVELDADYEWWRTRQQEARRKLSGISLTPAFVLIFRL